MDRAFFGRDAATVAQELLGCTLVHNKCRGRIVETEAYYGNQDVKDPASHAFAGETERNQVMFGPAGQSYVYICYGIHNMFNVTTDEAGTPGAILIRAVEPVDGIGTMKQRRGVEQETALCDGPGKLCQALNITKQHNDIDVTAGDLRIESGPAPEQITQTTRIGITEGADLELRFYDTESSHVSRR